MKTFACAARIKLYEPPEYTVFSGLVEAKYQEQAEQKLIRYIKRSMPNSEIFVMVVTDRYFTDEMTESEMNKNIEDFEIND